MIVTENVYRNFATTVNLLTSVSARGEQNIMACEWTMNVSFNPLDVMVVVGKKKYTHELILETQQFGVNMCAQEQAGLAHLAGDVSGRESDKCSAPIFKDVLYPAQQIKPMLVRGCFLNAECVVERTVDMGKYTGFVGRAVVQQANPDLIPLLYHQGKYFSMGGRIPKPAET
jgi:flavin reductase (DIM6/NTAB) family NADH-FMN oxidoreductase RutF